MKVLCYALDMSGDVHQWRQRVTAFASRLDEQQRSHSVKDLCDFLLRERWTDRDQVVHYLHDYLAVSHAHLQFHVKWAALSNMQSLAAHDRREIEKVEELLEALAA